MSVLLFVIGALVTMAGVGMVGYGIPINEFSFGNTLIVAGITAAVGGIMIIGIAAAIGQLRRIAEMLTTRAPLRSSQPAEMFEPPAGSRATPMPDEVRFPPKPKSETGIREPQQPAEAAAAPTLQNPDLPAVAVEEYEVEEYEAVSLSPQQPLPAPAPATETRAAPAYDARWRSSPPPTSPPQGRQPQTSYFDAMWPVGSRPAKRPTVDEPKPETPRSTVAAVPEATNSHPASEPPVAILKSGVVDGMGYTLYVDGSIEAELPQGTLRFASINELRNHLAKN